MSETIDPGAEKFSEENHPGEGGDRLQNEGAPVINTLRDGLRDNFLIILLGSVVISFLAGYFISRQQEAQKREQWAEILFRHAKDWLSSTAEQASSKGVQYGQQLNKSILSGTPAPISGYHLTYERNEDSRGIALYSGADGAIER